MEEGRGERYAPQPYLALHEQHAPHAQHSPHAQHDHDAFRAAALQQCGSLAAPGGLQRALKRPGSDMYEERQPHHHHQQHHQQHQQLSLGECGLPDLPDDGYGSLQPKKSPPSNGKKTKGRVKIKMEYIDNKLRRYTTFSKRKTGIMKKAYELSTLTGTQVMLLVASETGHVYTFATRKLQPMITSDSGKRLIQTCLNSPDPPSGAPVGDQRMSATGFEETELTYNIVDDDIKRERSPASSGESCDESGSDDDSPSDKYQRQMSGWIKPDSSPDPDHGKRDEECGTSQDKELKSAHLQPHNLPQLAPNLGMPGASMLCHPMGLEGLGSNLGLGNLAMGYPHGIILGLANQNSDGASSSQPQFITIPLSMAMAAAAATATATQAGSSGGAGNSSAAGGNDELQDLSTGVRK